MYSGHITTKERWKNECSTLLAICPAFPVQLYSPEIIWVKSCYQQFIEKYCKCAFFLKKKHFVQIYVSPAKACRRKMIAICANVSIQRNKKKATWGIKQATRGIKKRNLRNKTSNHRNKTSIQRNKKKQPEE